MTAVDGDGPIGLSRLQNDFLIIVVEAIDRIYERFFPDIRNITGL